MKRIGIALVIALLGAGLSWGQYGYQYMSGGYWAQAQFIGQEGWMAGAGGNILHTTDGGRNWEFQSNIERKLWYAPPNLSFNDVFFLNPQEGWACIDNRSQFVWHTTNGGRFWRAESLSLGTQYGYATTSKVFFATPLCGWIAGGSPNPFYDYGNILATTDGGRTWAYQDSSHGWNGILATDANHCWAVGNNGWTARTTNGGATWISQQVGPFITYYDVAFTDTLFGWACGYPGVIVHTTDGGQSWSQQPIGMTSDFTALQFLDRRKGFVVGDSGVILKTIDGGAHWALIPTGTTASLSAVTFGDTLHGWAIGEGGTTVETSDGGQTWLVSREGTTDRLQSVVFVGDSTGWAVSSEGNFLSTSNGGKNWSNKWDRSPFNAIEMANPSTGWLVGENGRVIYTNDGWNGSYWPIPVTQENLKDVFAGDSLHVWACGTHDVVIGSSDGGQTWREQFVWPETTLYDITFCDSVYGWALLQDGHVLRTRNGGRSWGMVGSAGKGNWYHGDYVDNQWGWVAGDSGIAHTTDGGKSWVRQNTGVTERLWDVSGTSRMRTWAVGENGRILATTDGGMSWSLQASPDSLVLRSVDFVDSLHGVACGNSYILDTRDGGVTWNRHGGGDYYAISLVDSLEGWAVGNHIYHTTDGGTTWQDIRFIGFPLRAVCFINRDEGWAGGNNQSQYGGFITHTTDRGVTWTDTQYSYQKMVYSLYYADRMRGWMGTGSYKPGEMWATTDGGTGWFPLLYPRTVNTAGNAVSSRTGVVCGSLGNLLRTTDGSIWERVMSPTQRNLWGITLGDEQTAWAVGQRGMIMTSTDQGLFWGVQRADSLSDSLLVSIQAFDGLTARATGYLGRSILTTDGGTTWQGEETGTKEWLLASSFLTPTLGWVVGENGMVLKYGRLPYGVEEEKGKPTMPLVTSLGQNRPNPFAERTEMMYQLANKGKVRLVVYNVLGQAVRRLVDREEEPGSYAMRWDGRDDAGRSVSSGVYFYRLETQGKSLTRKMVKVR